MSLRVVLMSVFTVALTMTVACTSDEQPKKDAKKQASAKRTGPSSKRARYNNLPKEGYAVKTLDLNEDQNPDQWYFNKADGTTSRIERDLNFDGRPDMWQYPNKSGVVVEQEMDLDNDGRVDVVAFYNDQAKLLKKELSLGFDGKFTVFKYYDLKGNLLRIEHDETGDGKINRWDYYENKRVVRVGWDENEDGLPDRFDTL